MNTGERIKRERKKLGYTQVTFAKACGVHRNTQIKYESGEREPDASYLVTMAQTGVDIGYVLTGRSENQEREAIWRVLLLFQENLRLTKYDNELESICQSALRDIQNYSNFDERNLNISETSITVFNLLKKSPVVLFDISAILEDVIEKIEFVLGTTGLVLYPSEKAEVITALLNECKLSDRKLGLDAVNKQLQKYRYVR